MAPATAANALTLDVEQKSNHVVVHCHGRLVAGVGHVLYTRVHGLFAEHKWIILDLTDLHHIDSMGLGTLVRLYASAKAAGARIELVNLGKQIRELLGITNLLAIFGDMCEKGVAMKF